MVGDNISRLDLTDACRNLKGACYHALNSNFIFLREYIDQLTEIKLIMKSKI